MKLMPLFLMLIVSLPFSYASIEITSQLNGEYNLGDDIPLSLKIVPDETANALLKSTLRCTNTEVLYYLVPVNLEQGEEVNMDIPAIKAFSEGLCNIRINVDSLEGHDIEGITSDDFLVSASLELSFTLDKTDVLPGDKIKIEGTATKGGGNIEDGSIIIVFGDKEEQIELSGDEFSYDLELDDNIKSGEHVITVEVNDSYENFNEKSMTINVYAVPTKLEFQLNKKEFKPKETLQLTVQLLDQADGVIVKNIDVSLLKERILLGDIVLFDEEIESNEEFDFTFGYNTTPNEYVLKAVFDDLEKEEVIEILPHSEIEMRLEGGIVFIKNIGNVEYNNKTTLILEEGDKTYLINKKIKLDVGEETTIDLSKELPSGTYTVTLPGETVTITEERIVEKTVEKIVEKEVPRYIERESEEAEEDIISEKEINVVENVEIEDNRPFYKKGLGFITGGFVAGAGLLLNRPKFASFFMIAIILFIIYYFNRKRFKKIIEKIREKRADKF